MQLLRPFGCRVLATDPNLSVEECKARGAHKVEFDTLLAESEIVTVHCPLLNSTRGMFADAAFAAMQDGAIFVSTARGFIHDESALDRALESGHLAGAGLDVWAPEPPAAEHPLLERTNVLVSPHTAGVTHESRARVARMAAESFIDVANGRLPPRLVNAEVLPDFKARAKALTGAV